MLNDEVVESSIDGIHIGKEEVQKEPKESEEKFEVLLDLMPDPVVIVDGKGKFLAVNDRVEEKTGFKRQELLGKNFLRTKIVTTKSKAVLMKNLAKRMMGMHVAPYEVEVLTKDGGKLAVEINAAKIEYEGKPADIVIFRDITERRKAEEALRESEEKFRTLAEQSPNMIFINKKGRVVYANKKCEELMGYKREDFYSSDFDFFTLISPESIDIVETSFSHHADGKEVVPYEYTLITKEGKKIQAILTTKLIRFEGESAILGIVTNITHRKQMEEKLKQYSEHLEELIRKRTDELLESEKRYSILVEEAGDGVAILQDEKIIFANRKIAEIAGYSRNELIGLPFEKLAELVDEKDRQPAIEIHERRLRGETVPPTHEIAIKSKTGECLPVEISATLVRYQGRPALLAIVRDISGRKRMEEQRLRLERLATIGELATMVGHDLRNPLQSIENATYYLNNEIPRLPIPQKAREMLQIINDSVNYADGIIRDLHDFSVTKKPILTKTNITAIVKEALSQLKAPENVKLITKLGRLPEIKVDKDMTRRVFLNLATNGIQAMEKGGTLRVSTKKTKGFVEVSFRDTGTGIPKEHMEKIFTPFFTTRAKGMGMGLPICKKFVDAHGGSIETKSEEGKGSTFKVKLPIQQENGGEKV